VGLEEKEAQLEGEAGKNSLIISFWDEGSFKNVEGLKVFGDTIF